MEIELVDVTAANWRDVAAVTPHPDQRRFVATATYYLCLCHYGGQWSPLAVVGDGAVVGFVMWAEDTPTGAAGSVGWSSMRPHSAGVSAALRSRHCWTGSPPSPHELEVM